MTVRLRAGAATDQGRVRTINQDSYRLRPERDLFIVADGMGGHRGGEVAAQMAVELIDEHYDEATPAGLRAALLAANAAIYDRSVDDADLRGMGTTAVVAALVSPLAGSDGATAGGPGGAEIDAGDLGEDGDAGDLGSDASGDGGPGQLVVANVGDSRGYLYRDGDLIQLTEDHSMVADLVRQGRITQDEADHHPQRNIVTRVLGVYEHIEVDLWPIDPLAGDRILLCSDGLFNEVGAETIGAVLRRLADPDEAADELVRLANEGGGRDNITVVLVDVLDDDADPAAASAGLAAGAATSSGLAGASDLAGFGTATGEPTRAGDTAGPGGTGRHDSTDGPDGGPVAGRRARRAERRATRAARPRTRFTWRVAVFLVALAAALGGAYATIVWYGTSTYFVGYDGDDVVIYRGRPGGLLWIDPEVAEPTPIERARVPARYARVVEEGREQATIEDARRLVENIRLDAGLDEQGRPTTTTTTTTSTTTPTTTTTTTAGD